MTDGSHIEEVSSEIFDEVEADCYWCLTKLLSGIQDHYTADQPGVQRMVMKLQELVLRIDVPLCEHLRGVDIEFMQFAFKWMNCLLLREFTLDCVMRLWDTYLSEELGFEHFHVYVCAAFLCQFSSELQEMEFDELFQFMQNMPTEHWGDTEVEVLLSQAYVLSTLFGGSDAHLANTSKVPLR
uniref:Rab-GAP TBC domain-containing protein n=1 Tax=Proboscia inermis TaxID=420281 RepID=A0A7S0GH76_9STRA|mmetsp:Transcript_36470/g.36708  ORF Transcript_36470/g.36708 Transcript_36470/m.36708 type:complete len:183 (+) Transcript_36470:601-1149(+)